MVMGVAVFNGEEPCCPHYGDAVELPLPGALAWSEHWHACINSGQRGSRDAYTVYLLPADRHHAAFEDERVSVPAAVPKQLALQTLQNSLLCRHALFPHST
jgi:hypothetical protein